MLRTPRRERVGGDLPNFADSSSGSWTQATGRSLSFASGRSRRAPPFAGQREQTETLLAVPSGQGWEPQRFSPKRESSPMSWKTPWSPAQPDAGAVRPSLGCSVGLGSRPWPGAAAGSSTILIPPRRPLLAPPRARRRAGSSASVVGPADGLTSSGRPRWALSDGPLGLTPEPF